MQCIKCPAQRISPTKTCAAGVEPYILKNGHLGCAYNTAKISKAMLENQEKFPVRSSPNSKRAAELTDRELAELFVEIYEWKNSGKISGDLLRQKSEEWFGKDAGMLSSVESFVLFEMARRYANKL